MRKGNPHPFTPEIEQQLAALERMSEEQIDLTEMPEVKDWTAAVRGRFRAPNGTASLPIDSDVLAYFEAQGPGYVDRINQVLRTSMLRAMRKRRVGS